MLSNFHTHTNYCDGKGDAQTYAVRAETLGLTSLGFSSHAPLPFDCAWCMQKSQLPEYLRALKTIRSQLKNVELYIGLEVDYIPNVTGPGKFRAELDYTIGSIHFADQLPNTKHWEIDGSFEVFKEGLALLFTNNIKDAVTRYFELTREMIRTDCPTIVGHLDKIKIHNKHQSLFSESDDWYQQQVTQTLDELARQGAFLEVNTRGIYQGKTVEPYPGWRALLYAYQKKIPIVLNSDAHHPDQLIQEFLPVMQSLAKIGYRESMVLRQGSWQAVPLAPKAN